MPDIIGTNTLNSLEINWSGSKSNLEKTISSGVSNLQHFRIQHSLDFAIAGKLGPTAISLSRTSDNKKTIAERYFNSYYHSLETLYLSGVDIILLETFYDSQNFDLAFKAYLEVMHKHRLTCEELPLIASFTPNTELKLVDGKSLIELFEGLAAFNLWGIGLNCISDLSLVDSLCLELMLDNLIIYPNAGSTKLPENREENQVLKAQELIEIYKKYNLKAMGGCCGFTQYFYQELRAY